MEELTTTQLKDAIFITGATGLVGSHLAEALIQQGKRVKAIYRKNIPQFTWSEKIEWVKGDILDIILLEEAMQNVKQVYHCAAVVSFNPKEKKALSDTNI